VNRRRIQPKVAVELETVSLRLPVELVRALEQYAKYHGGSSDRTYVITQAIETALQQDAEFQKTLSARPAVHRRTCPRNRVAVPAHLENASASGGARPAPPASPRNTLVFTPTPLATDGGLSLFPRL
jgi:hypothetical protein